MGLLAKTVGLVAHYNPSKISSVCGTDRFGDSFRALARQRSDTEQVRGQETVNLAGMISILANAQKSKKKD